MCPRTAQGLRPFASCVWTGEVLALRQAMWRPTLNKSFTVLDLLAGASSLNTLRSMYSCECKGYSLAYVHLTTIVLCVLPRKSNFTLGVWELWKYHGGLQKTMIGWHELLVFSTASPWCCWRLSVVEENSKEVENSSMFFFFFQKESSHGAMGEMRVNQKL